MAKSPRLQVLAAHPHADLRKVNIASWGVTASYAEGAEWLSYGQPTWWMAWRKAAEKIASPSTQSRGAK